MFRVESICGREQMPTETQLRRRSPTRWQKPFSGLVQIFARQKATDCFHNTRKHEPTLVKASHHFHKHIYIPNAISNPIAIAFIGEKKAHIQNAYIRRAYIQTWYTDQSNRSIH